jgi:hypothetical protein
MPFTSERRENATRAVCDSPGGRGSLPRCAEGNPEAPTGTPQDVPGEAPGGPWYLRGDPISNQDRSCVPHGRLDRHAALQGRQPTTEDQYLDMAVELV